MVYICRLLKIIIDYVRRISTGNVNCQPSAKLQWKCDIEVGNVLVWIFAIMIYSFSCAYLSS